MEKCTVTLEKWKLHLNLIAQNTHQLAKMKTDYILWIFYLCFTKESITKETFSGINIVTVFRLRKEATKVNVAVVSIQKSHIAYKSQISGFPYFLKIFMKTSYPPKKFNSNAICDVLMLPSFSIQS